MNIYELIGKTTSIHRVCEEDFSTVGMLLDRIIDNHSDLEIDISNEDISNLTDMTSNRIIEDCNKIIENLNIQDY